MADTETSKTAWQQLCHGFKASLDEAALFGGGAIGAYLINYFQNRSQNKKAKTLEQARKLHEEGKHDEAKDLVIQSKIFGIGYGDECGMLAVQAFVVQFLLDSGEQGLVDNFLDALGELDEETLERLRLSLAVIDSVEERGMIMVKLARTPGDLKVRIAQHCRTAGIQLDPANHPANVLVGEIGGAIHKATGGYAAKLEAARQQLRERQAARAARRSVAREKA